MWPAKLSLDCWRNSADTHYVRFIGLMCLLMSVSRASDPRALQEASIEKQRASVRAQEATAAARQPSFFTTPAPEIACERVPALQVSHVVDEGARQSGLDVSLVRAVVHKESAYDSCATSVKGAQGLMQLMPSVQMQFGVTDPYDPGQNVGAGTKLLKQLLEQYGGDLSRALGAYNAGPARVEKWGGVPPIPETRKYVDDILSDLSR
jgi:soluble lytic murein transglycosylase-like protein